MNRREDRLDHLREQQRAIEHFLSRPDLLKPEMLESFKERLSFIEEDIRNTENF